MDLLLVLKAVVLGVVEGLTEFLPVSSTGHLIITGDFIDFTGDRANTFEIFIQLGAILGVVWYYRDKLFSILSDLGAPTTQRLVLNLIIAFIPAAAIGLLLHSFIKAYLFSPLTVGAALVVGGFLILLIEALPIVRRIETMEAMGPMDALKVGIAQTAALFPGVSRAGATIMGGLLGGLSRSTATEFSFFLAIPTMFAATLYDLYKGRAALHRDDTLLFGAGFVVAFLVALVVVHLFLSFVKRHDFRYFAYYRIGFGLIVLAYFWPTT
jgi:undecaprenyl-diphosphatase